MRRLACLLVPLLLLVLVLPAWAEEDVLDTYRDRFERESFLSDKEDVLRELSATGDKQALKALLWCIDHAEEVVEKRQKQYDKVYREYVPVFERLLEKERNYIQQFLDRGKPAPTKRPKFPEDDEVLSLRAQLKDAERAIDEARHLLDLSLGAHGGLVARLEPSEQEKLRAKWERGPLGSRDWQERADQYRLLGHTPTDWAFRLLQDASMAEEDPRALAAAIDSLSGKDVKVVTPIFLRHLEDTRWLVQVAAVAALEGTPSKEGVDALVARIVTAEGRLLDDLTRALKTLTGADIRADGDLWRRYWEANRTAWNGPPEPEKDDEEEPLDPLGEFDKEKEEARAEDAKKTGFFGLDVKSRRLVYVIDVSGSMNEQEGDKTRAAAAKEELQRSILALEDGAHFNIVFFSSGVQLWEDEMVVADSETRRAAHDFIAEVAVQGGTNTFDALDAAFALGDVGKGKRREADPEGDSLVDTIILLSDGAPTFGKTTTADGIREAVRRWNESRRIAIHTIAFGAGAEKELMEGLAKDSGGTFLAK